MKNWKHWELVAIIAFWGIIFGFTACDDSSTKDEKKETASFEGSWNDYYYNSGFVFSGDTFTWQKTAGASRKGTFTKTKSQITFNSTHEYRPGEGLGNWDWVPLTSSSGRVPDFVNFLDSGNPVDYKFSYSDGKVRGVTIGDTSYTKLR
jgi:hypothetical protein